MRLSLAAAALLLAAPRPTLAEAPDPHIARVERNLLPPVVISGSRPWTLEERMQHYKVPGVSIAVIDGGKIAWARGYGVLETASRAPVTVHTLFQAGSISKPVAATGVLRLAEMGRLSLDVPVNSLLKSWQLPETELTAKTPVTLTQILSHTAGLTVHGFPGYALGEPVPTVPQVLDGAPPANTAAVRVELPPGSKFQYSGGGYTIAQLVVTDVTGQPFPEEMRTLVLGPLHMADSTYQQPLPPDLLARAAVGYRRNGQEVKGQRHTYPEMAAAGLWTTASDLARFAIGIEQAWAGTPGAVLAPAMAKRMLTRVSDRTGLGLFLDPAHPGTFGHDGSDEGFQATLIASIAGGHGIAVMANSDNGVALANEIVRGAAQVYGWKDLSEPVLQRVTVTAATLERDSGRYALGFDDVLTVTRMSAELQGQTAGGAPFPLIPIRGGNFARPDQPARYRFDGTGVTVETPAQPGAPAASATRISGARLAAGQKTPLEFLLDGQIDAALTAYRRIRADHRGDPAVAEERFNQLGYHLAETNPAQGIAVLRFNTELYPDSANTWDSLGEVLLATGKRDEALRCYRQVVAVLPRDTATSPGLKTRLLRNAEVQIAELQRDR